MELAVVKREEIAGERRARVVRDVEPFHFRQTVEGKLSESSILRDIQIFTNPDQLIQGQAPMHDINRWFTGTTPRPHEY
ncbi:hypothetical protein PG994_003861 [Apiospora phragmitis]|uniref:Uncharacterized protein n=1 Tax=Apiospora phragmitis TaxID=2905665 RepID=A0ABR1VZB2_9PEZI